MEPSTSISIRGQNEISLVPARERAYSKIREDMSGYAFVLAVTGLSQIGLFYKPQIGVFLTTAALGILMAVAAKYSRVRSVVLGIAIIPLLGMINLSFVQQSAFAQTLVLYSSMLILSAFYRILLPKRVAPMTQTNTHALSMKYLLGAGIAGTILGLLSYKLLVNNYVFGGTPISLVVGAAIVGALAEESLFRGLIQKQATYVMRPIHAVVLTGLVYLTLSFSHFSPWSLVVGIISSLVLSILYMKKSSLILTTALNITSKLVYIGMIAKYLIH